MNRILAKIFYAFPVVVLNTFLQDSHQISQFILVSDFNGLPHRGKHFEGPGGKMTKL